MYSGTTLTNFSGRIMGAHQKIDRVARRHLDILAPNNSFPSVKQILHFEGNNGPDGVKRKSPAIDEEWHYFLPFDTTDTQILDIISNHYKDLVKALVDGDKVRVAFEAAWLAHGAVDGLTPAHQYPYTEKLIELRGGEGIESRTTIKEKVIQPGDNRRDQLVNNWRMWGPKGLMTTHGAFEWGVATSILPARLKVALPTEDDIQELQELGLCKWYRQVAQDVAKLNLYEDFSTNGWSYKLARRVRTELAPIIVRCVTLLWLTACQEAAGVELPVKTAVR